MSEKIKKEKNSGCFFVEINEISVRLFCLSQKNGKTQVHFLVPIENLFYLSSGNLGRELCLYLQTSSGILEFRFPKEIKWRFYGMQLIFKIHSEELFEELVASVFCFYDELILGGQRFTLKGFGCFLNRIKKNRGNDRFLLKLKMLPVLGLLSFFVQNKNCTRKKEAWKDELPVVTEEDISGKMQLSNLRYRDNFYEIVAFYLTKTQDANLFFSEKAMICWKNLFLIFLFPTYIFPEDKLYKKLISFNGDAFLSLLKLRDSLSFYIEFLVENQKMFPMNFLHSRYEDNGFFLGQKMFLFFHFNAFRNRCNQKDECFLLSEKCFLTNKKKKGSTWGIAFFPGACVPVFQRVMEKYLLLIYPSQESAISFQYKEMQVIVNMSQTLIEIVYICPRIEKILLVISPFRISKIQKNGVYFPLIVKRNQDCIELNCEDEGKIQIFLNHGNNQ